MLARVSHREQAAVGNADDWSDQILSFDGPGLTGYDPKTGKTALAIPAHQYLHHQRCSTRHQRGGRQSHPDLNRLRHGRSPVYLIQE